MGLIKAGIGAIGGNLADQWKEFIYCDSLSADTLVVRGQKKTGSRSSNTKGEDNVISNGSGIAIADGQCMIIVEQGKVVDICAEPGEYTYKTDLAPSLFTGSLGENVKNTFKNIGKRFTYGGDTGVDQRVYFINTKEIMDNKFGTANPVPFRIVDRNIGIDIDLSVRASGTYSYRIADPIIFYSKICGNVKTQYDRSEIDGQLKAEFIDALQPALSMISELGLRPSQIIAHNMEMKKAMNEVLSESWGELRGLEIVKIAFGSVTLPDDEAELLQKYQKSNVLTDPRRAAGYEIDAHADAMRDAAKNTSGAMTGFMGMGMASNQTSVNTSALYAMGQNDNGNQRMAEPAPTGGADTWKCVCGVENIGKFCTECGKGKPSVSKWKCICGAENTGKFCSECGAKRPERAKCAHCGWEAEDENQKPKFCPECGEKF